jgi:regulatory protein
MMEEEKSEQHIFLKMAHLCSRSEQCTPDIVKRIRELGGSSQMTEAILDKLAKENYLNDGRYVSLYVREKFTVNKWGRIKMHYYLKMKGLKEELIQSGFKEINEDDYVALLVKTMKEKARTIRSTEKYEKMGQIIRFTQGRGFEPELIHRYLNQAIS